MSLKATIKRSDINPLTYERSNQGSCCYLGQVVEQVFSEYKDKYKINNSELFFSWGRRNGMPYDAISLLAYKISVACFESNEKECVRLFKSVGLEVEFTD